MRTDDRHAAVTSTLAGWTDRLVAMAAARAGLTAEFDELIAATRSAQAQGHTGNARLSRLQAIDEELIELDASAAKLIASCTSLICRGW